MNTEPTTKTLPSDNVDTMGPRGRRLCLVVEDSTAMRKTISHIVGSFDFDIAEAENGRAALAQVKKRIPTLIVLDWNMPLMNGLEFLKELRSQEEGQSPLVMFCTTENQERHMAEAMKMGANEYIMKPFDHTIFRDKLRILNLVG